MRSSALLVIYFSQPPEGGEVPLVPSRLLTRARGETGRHCAPSFSLAGFFASALFSWLIAQTSCLSIALIFGHHPHYAAAARHHAYSRAPPTPALRMFSTALAPVLSHRWFLRTVASHSHLPRRHLRYPPSRHPYLRALLGTRIG